MFILADSVGHIVGSDVLNTAFEEMELNVAVSPLSVAAGDLADMFAMIRRIKNVAGFGVTIPHKIVATQLVDELTDAARDIGAVNFVRRNADGSLTGHNIDGEGFLAGLGEHGVAVHGASVLQIGAAGSAAPSPSRWRVPVSGGSISSTATGRRRRNWPRLIGALGTTADIHVHASEDELPQEIFDLVVNATSLGMHEGDLLPLSPSRLAASTIVAEVIMTPVTTPILAEAERIGCRTGARHRDDAASADARRALPRAGALTQVLPPPFSLSHR